MRRPTPLLAALAAAAAAVASIGLAAPGASAATWHRPGVLPSHVFAPYFETYDTTDGGLAQLAAQSGNRYLSLAFLETAQAGSCTAYWNGDTTTPIAPASFGSDIAAIQAHGGNVIPSFGGYTADTTSTDIADSCTSVPAIAQVYEDLITTYHVPRIDLDVEADSLSNTAGINRRNEAVALTEHWAARHGIPIQFSYTLPSTTTGLDAADDALLQNAISDGARVSTVNLLTFDYYIGTEQDMLADTQSAAAGSLTELQSLYPNTPQARLRNMIGITEMPGIDDFGPDETFTAADASALLHWARSAGIGTLSFWALQRDNGTCPGTKGAGACSGITQPTWYFSHAWESFSGPWWWRAR
jgi:hypothetical protein